MIHGSSLQDSTREAEFREVRAGRPTTTKQIRNLSAAEDLAGVGLVVDLTDFERKPWFTRMSRDWGVSPRSDSDSSGDDDSETK
ncbi:hypothetical protein Bca52824_000372 [Brassica carinata]|uniref:Uncharacterized protein n=1 Tax=Brassica carinata TaxID=52824 RepID=A0A8X7WH19_BRACI|nr:hypothetical protein Bca52824_000372 [Brassica carinata]